MPFLSTDDQAQQGSISRRGFLTASAIAALMASVGASIANGDVAHAAWGGYSNGNIPTSVLAAIPWDTERILRTDARDALVSLNGAFRPHFGHDITINDGYRDYDEQVRAKKKFGANAAEPGTSNHGWAIAVDVANTSRVQIGYSHPIYLWLKANGPAYGWVHPQWAEPGNPGGPDEAWHWEFNGTFTGGPAPAQPEVRSMEAIVKVPSGVIVHLRNGGKTNFGSQQQYNDFRAQVNTLRQYGATDLLPLPEMSVVPGVTWETYTFLAQYFGAPAE